jgi:hypothetical protein
MSLRSFGLQTGAIRRISTCQQAPYAGLLRRSMKVLVSTE